MLMPTYYIPHGGGPCFFIDWPFGDKNTWKKLENWLRKFPKSLPEKPTALVIVSGHWQTANPTVTSIEEPRLIYDYHGFPGC